MEKTPLLAENTNATDIERRRRPAGFKSQLANQAYIVDNKFYFIPVYVSTVIKSLRNLNMPLRTVECLFTLNIKI